MKPYTIYILYTLISIIILYVFISFFKNKPIIEEYLDLHLVTKKNTLVNKKILVEGNNYFKKKNVIICGLARDIEHRINTLEKNLDNMIRCFNNYIILIVENDSSDNTRTKLLELKNKYNIYILGCGVDSTKKCSYNIVREKGCGKSRMGKMVNLRNIYMDYINKNIDKKKYDYCIMLDCDLNTIMNKKYISSSGYYFKKYNYIDAIGCNGIRTFIPHNIYYDLYALDSDDKDTISFLTRFEYNFESKGIITDLVKVNSCFAGFVIYKLESIFSKNYFLEENDFGGVDCEHVTFNKQLKGVYINPKMLFPIFAHD